MEWISEHYHNVILWSMTTFEEYLGSVQEQNGRRAAVSCGRLEYKEEISSHSETVVYTTVATGPGRVFGTSLLGVSLSGIYLCEVRFARKV